MKKGIQCFLSLLMISTLIACQSQEVKKEEPVEEEQVEVVEPEVVKQSLTLSFIGDVTLGNYAGQGYSGSFDAEYENRGKNANYFFKNVKSIFEKDDLTIANLEGPLTTADPHPDKTFAFKGKPEYVNILTSGNIDVVTLANNHSADRYEKGMKDTKKVLDENNIGHFGYDENYIAEVNGVKIGFLGYAFPQSFSDNMKKAIQSLDKNTDIIVVYYHWGIERDYAPMASQRKIAKSTIDAGADLVIGSHPHVLQGIETYKGKNIVYSLGNFCFGGNKNPSDKDTAIYQHTFDLEDKVIVNESSHIIPCRLSSQTSRNNYQPTIVDGSTADRVLKKIGTVK